MYLNHFVDSWELVGAGFRPTDHRVGANGLRPNSFHLGSWRSRIIECDTYGAIVVVKALTMITNILCFHGVTV